MSALDLNNLGVSAEEYALYKAVLKEPIVNVSRYAVKHGIKRPTLYNLLDQMVRKGLLNKTQGTIRYSAQPPAKLLELAEAARQRTLEEIEALKKEVPLLAAFELSKKEDSEVFVLRGPEVREQSNAIMAGPTETLLGFTYNYHVEVYFNIDRDGNLVEDGYLQDVMRVGDKFVFPGSDEAIEQTQSMLRRYPQLEGKWQPRWVDPELFDFRINMTVNDDKTLFSHVGHEEDHFACLIRDDKLAAAMKSISLFIWNHAHPIH